MMMISKFQEGKTVLKDKSVGLLKNWNQGTYIYIYIHVIEFMKIKYKTFFNGDSQSS